LSPRLLRCRTDRGFARNHAERHPLETAGIRRSQVVTGARLARTLPTSAHRTLYLDRMHASGGSFEAGV